MALLNFLRSGSGDALYPTFRQSRLMKGDVAIGYSPSDFPPGRGLRNRMMCILLQPYICYAIKLYTLDHTLLVDLERSCPFPREGL